ncbi:XRE family transcriptional regulator [Saccharopolyspora karakumensis]|uniref:XRE family transcriptional regulator n=1 Tax=Saccharopolyspora karakumensis TaxID=2530386 RepID=A0A4R5BB13_9PSEU|nr:helix-turn-helix transcriptional regulator [Saccharopolyspora karakumensis]TDD82319.1 XRE family transcriptional regulator [Saccharopolyspora karakumensis]
MRGAGHELSIGERIAFYRRRRGLSQSVLAGLLGRTEDWLSKVERGERQVNRIDVLVELARQLRGTLNDLLGDPRSVVERGARVRSDSLPVERQVTHAIDMARSMSMVALDDEAVGLLLRAEAQAPYLVRHSSVVREVVRTVYRRSPVSSGRSSPLMALAERCRAVR